MIALEVKPQHRISRLKRPGLFRDSDLSLRLLVVEVK